MRAPAAHEHRAEVRHVEHDRALATGAVLLEHAGVLDRHVPAAELDHARAELTVLGVERAVSQRGVGHADSACGPEPRRGRRPGREEVERSRLARAGDVDELRRRLEPVLHEEVQVVALVEHLDLDLGVQLAQAARLAVLLRHELLVQRRDLDVEVVRGEVEVGRERLHRVAVAVTLERERARLVVPLDAVEVEQLRELPLRVVREADLLVRERLRDGSAPLGGASRVRRGGRGRCARAGSGAPVRGQLEEARLSSCTTLPSGTMLRTPWPRRTRSTRSSPSRARTEFVPSRTMLAVSSDSPRSSRRYSIALRAVASFTPASRRLFTTLSRTRSRYE